MSSQYFLTYVLHTVPQVNLRSQIVFVFTAGTATINVFIVHAVDITPYIMSLGVSKVSLSVLLCHCVLIPFL